MRSLAVAAVLLMFACSGSGGDGGAGGGGSATGGGSSAAGGGSSAAGGGSSAAGGGSSAAGGGSSAAGGGSSAAGGGTATGGGTAAGGGSATGGGSGEPCALADGGNTCGSGMYCNAPGCTGGTGTCMALPPNLVKDPVCGCNGVTYWNVGAAAGQTIGSTGQCGNNALACSAAVDCPNGTHCNHYVVGPSVCGFSQAYTCWGLPGVCPGLAGQSGTVGALACGANACADECTLIQSGMQWFADMCP